jgi:hypothetical protein
MQDFKKFRELQTLTDRWTKQIKKSSRKKHNSEGNLLMNIAGFDYEEA